MKNNSLISLRSLVHFIQEKINVETFHVFSSGSMLHIYYAHQLDYFRAILAEYFVLLALSIL